MVPQIEVYQNTKVHQVQNFTLSITVKNSWHDVVLKYILKSLIPSPCPHSFPEAGDNTVDSVDEKPGSYCIDLVSWPESSSKCLEPWKA